MIGWDPDPTILPLNLRTLGGSLLMLKVRKQDAVSIVQARAAFELNVEPEQVTLCIGNCRISDDVSLSTLGDATLQVIVAQLPQRLIKFKRTVEPLLHLSCEWDAQHMMHTLGQIAMIHRSKTEDLSLFVDLILSKALCEPHYCQAYIQLVSQYSQCLRRPFLDAVQMEFDKLPASLTFTEDEKSQLSDDALQFCMRMWKQRCRTLLEVLAYLCLHGLVPFKLVASVLEDFLQGEPDIYRIECVCLALQLFQDLQELRGREQILRVLERITNLVRERVSTDSASFRWLRHQVQSLNHCFRPGIYENELALDTKTCHDYDDVQ